MMRMSVYRIEIESVYRIEPDMHAGTHKKVLKVPSISETSSTTRIM